MAHNLSQRKKRETVLASPIGWYHEWHFLVLCGRCKEERQLRVLDVLERVGGSVQVQAVVLRLRCDVPRCGSPPYAVSINYRDAIKIRLTGPGAYA